MEIIENAAKYLIQLYYGTGYECTRQKLQKIIIFAHLHQLFNDNDGFTDKDFITVSPMGLGIEIISERYYNFIIGEKNDEKKISISGHIDNSMFKEAYRYDDKILTDKYKNILLEMFTEYGSYSGEKLSRWTMNMDLWEENIEAARQKGIYTIPKSDVDTFINKVKKKSCNKDFFKYIESLK